MAKQKFNITGMTCSACSAHVEKAVRRLKGVKAADVSLMTNSMTAEFDDNILSAQEIIAAIIQSGYGASLPQKRGSRTVAEPKEDAMVQELASMKRRMVWSFAFLIPLFYISMGHMMGATLPAFLVGPENAIALCLSQLLMDSLIAVGSAAAVL